MKIEWRTVGFGALTALFVIAAVEILAYLAIAIVLRAPTGLAAIHVQQDALAHSEVATKIDREVRNRAMFGKEAVHPYFGFVNEPWMKTGFALNGDAPLPRRSPKTLTIGITGGSVAAGFARSAEALLAPRLRAAPEWADREIAVVSLAQAGWKQPQQLQALAYLLAAGGELDVLINVDGFNEVALHAAENQLQGVFPAFPRNWAMRTRLIPDPSLLPLVGRYAELEGDRKRWARELARPPLRYSATVAFAWLAGDRMFGAELFETQRALREHRPDVTDYAWTGPQRSFADDDALAEELVSIWSRSSAQLQRLCNANGIRYLHLLQPNQYVAGSKPMDAEERRIAWNEGNPFRPGAERAYPRLVRECRRLAERGVACRDLTQLFAGVREPLYVDDCCHFNERGFAMMADYAVRALREDSGAAH